MHKIISIILALLAVFGAGTGVTMISGNHYKKDYIPRNMSPELLQYREKLLEKQKEVEFRSGIIVLLLTFGCLIGYGLNQRIIKLAKVKPEENERK